MKRWDVVVVGAGFAGLAAAASAARAGLRTLVVDRKAKVGASVHTTGLLCPESLRSLDPPAAVAGTRLDALEVRGPRRATLRLERAGAGFTPTRTGDLLAELERRAVAAEAEVRTGSRVRAIEEHAGGATLHVGRETVEAARVVVASGARRGASLLAGVERHVLARAGALPQDACTLLLDERLAPGYCAWAFAGCDGIWQLGVLGRPRAGWRPDHALDAFTRLLERDSGFEVRQVVEVRGGVVPVGGAKRARAGRVIACGDAADHVSPLTAGGIGRAYRAGALVGQALAGDESALRAALARARRGSGGARSLLRAAFELAEIVPADLRIRAARTLALSPLLEDVAFRPNGLTVRAVAPRPRTAD